MFEVEGKFALFSISSRMAFTVVSTLKDFEYWSVFNFQSVWQSTVVIMSAPSFWEKEFFIVRAFGGEIGLHGARRAVMVGACATTNYRFL
jgi:hypothetical protein